MKKIKNYYIPNNDKHFENYFNHYNHYQEAQRNRALSFVKKWDLAIDIGANIGLWSKDLTNFFDQTICFEPNLDCLDCLKKNINIKKSIIYDFALGNKEENKIIYCPDNTGASSFINYTKTTFKKDGSIIYGAFPKNTKKKLVKIKKFDSFYFKNINFIKIDVQGYEFEVLKGAEKSLRESSPVICIEEENPKNSKSLKFLQSLDYNIVDVIIKEHILKKK